ncbi:hypothetical protein AURDEDRAFT_172261 [Auricularia subglabra TFB-10046 SS5]|nr:hypothetical protein AURDEDRAFT_172261 [Auricularia subglabra TFB-10046 SS5]
MVKTELPSESSLPHASAAAVQPAVASAITSTCAADDPLPSPAPAKRPRTSSTPRLSRKQFTSTEVAHIRDTFTAIVGEQHREALIRWEDGFNSLSALLGERDELESKLREHMAKIEALDVRCNVLQAELVEAQAALMALSDRYSPAAHLALLTDFPFT